MKPISAFPQLPTPFGPGCVVFLPPRSGWGLRRAALRVAAFGLAAGTCLGVMAAGHDAPTAAGVTLAASVAAVRLTRGHRTPPADAARQTH
ncbi:hypothetical protein ACFQ2B_01510 [Streptomyces stramineus]|uniref:Uncharacterized protein n=1 Tax=Streptomyces stramineus TaxID=173861 RepID=A0ABP3KE77_9ACTN